MDKIKPYKRKIWFLRSDEREEEERKARVANHIRLCNEFWDEIANFLYIQTPEVATLIIDEIRKYLDWLLKTDDNRT